MISKPSSPTPLTQIEREKLEGKKTKLTDTEMLCEPESDYSDATKTKRLL